jgi:hypothetical protein
VISKVKLNRLEKSVLLIVAALALATGIASADLGDTVASSEAKYGKPTRVDLPCLNYIHNGWWIRQTFNANEICVMAEFVRLDGKQVTDTQAHNMDSHNLPAYTLNTTSNGWVTTKWDNTGTFNNVQSHLWSTSQEWWQVLAGQFRYGNDTKWFFSRTYITPAGQAIVNHENAKGNQSTETVSSPDTNI